MNYFTITTTPEVAEKIKKQCEWDERMGCNRSIVLGDIRSEKGLGSEFSVVQIKARNGKIVPSDIFFLGLFCANR